MQPASTEREKDKRRPGAPSLGAHTSPPPTSLDSPSPTCPAQGFQSGNDCHPRETGSGSPGRGLGRAQTHAGPPRPPQRCINHHPTRGRADRQGQSGARPGSGRHGKTCQHLWTELLPPASPSAGLINTLPGAGPEGKEKPLRPQKES